MSSGSIRRLVALIAVAAMAVFAALTVAVTAGHPLAIDSHALQIAEHGG